MIFLRIKEALIWWILSLSLRVILEWLQVRRCRFYPSLVDSSVKNLLEFCELDPKVKSQIKDKLIRNFFLEKTIIDSASSLIKPSSFFPYSFASMTESLRKYDDFQSLIILTYHVSGFTLLIDLISVALLENTTKDIVILYGFVNLSRISHLKETWVQSKRLRFVSNDQIGLLSLRQNLRKGSIIFALIDSPQAENSSNVLPAKLMNHSVFLKTGILRLASTFDIPILPVSHHFYHCQLVYKFHPILSLSQEEFNEPEVLKDKLKDLLQPLSEIIQEHPEQWLLWHKLTTR
jgi:lauroyl/myristoyl acyltransferase